MRGEIDYIACSFHKTQYGCDKPHVKGSCIDLTGSDTALVDNNSQEILTAVCQYFCSVSSFWN